MEKKRFRFHIRTLLIVTTLIAVVCMFVGNRMYRDHLEKEANEALRKAGVRVEMVDEQITRAYLAGNFPDESIRKLIPHLKNLPKLAELDFVRVPMSDEVVNSLGELHRLKIIYVFETALTDEGIKQLSEMLPNAMVKTDEPDPIASGMSASTIYPHAMVTLAWSPDGKRMATGSGDGMVRVWDNVSPFPVHEWKAHSKWAFAVEYSPDGKTIATGGGDHTVRIWDAENCELVAELIGHTDDVHAIGYTPDGEFLVSASDDRTIRVWDVHQKKTVRKIVGHQAQIPSMDVSPDGRLIATSSRDETVRVWELDTGNALAVLTAHEDDVMSVAFDPTGSLLASGGNGGEIKVWDVSTFEQLHSMRGDEDQIYRLAFDRSGSRLASSGDDGVRIWDVAAGSGRDFAAQEQVASVAFNPRDEVLASTNAGGEIHLLNPESLETNRILRTMFGERGLELDSE